MIRIRRIAVFILLLTSSQLAYAEQKVSTNAGSGAMTWETKQHGVHFSLTQILPDQGRAFYVNRGFTLKQAQSFATSCVYMTVLRNEDASGTIHFIRNNWKVVSNGKPHQLKPIKSWLGEYEKLGIAKPARVAFRWAQFPPEQEYEPGGDWNQGMLSVGLKPETIFDITAIWDINSKPYEATLSGVQCAKDN